MPSSVSFSLLPNQIKLQEKVVTFQTSVIRDDASAAAKIDYGIDKLSRVGSLPYISAEYETVSADKLEPFDVWLRQRHPGRSLDKQEAVRQYVELFPSMSLAFSLLWS